MMAAAALAEAQATIARQQVMLDRALESNGDMQAQIARLRGALTDIKDIYWGSGEADIAKAITDTTAPEP